MDIYKERKGEIGDLISVLNEADAENAALIQENVNALNTARDAREDTKFLKNRVENIVEIAEEVVGPLSDPTEGANDSEAKVSPNDNSSVLPAIG